VGGNFPAMDAATDRPRYDSAQVLHFFGAVLIGFGVLLGLFGIVRLLSGSELAGMVWTAMFPAVACLGLGAFLRQIAGYDPDAYDADLFD
jgi:hypothetical protein